MIYGEHTKSPDGYNMLNGSLSFRSTGPISTVNPDLYATQFLEYFDRKFIGDAEPANTLGTVRCWNRSPLFRGVKRIEADLGTDLDALILKHVLFQ